MVAGQLRHTDSRTSKPRRTRRKSSKGPGAWWPERLDADQTTEAEKIDSLLLSALTAWEVDRDLIEERMAAIGR